jgi:hypothetical protein
LAIGQVLPIAHRSQYRVSMVDGRWLAGKTGTSSYAGCWCSQHPDQHYSLLPTRAGRYKTDKPAAGCGKRDKTKKRAPPEKQRKSKTKQRLLLNRQKAWICGLWTRMMNYFTEVCVENFIYFILKPQELSKPAPKPQPPRGFALRLKRPDGSIEIRRAGGEPLGERATGTCF